MTENVLSLVLNNVKDGQSDFSCGLAGEKNPSSTDSIAIPKTDLLKKNKQQA